MKKRHFLFLGIILVIIFQTLIISALQARVVAYNFTTNLSDRNAYKEYPAARDIFNGTNTTLYGNATPTEYTNLGTRNKVNFSIWPKGGGGNDEPMFRFNFTALEVNNNRDRIQWLTVNVTAAENATEFATLFMWNFTSGALTNVTGIVGAAHANYSMNYTGNVNATNFIQSSSGNVTVYMEGDNYDAADGMHVDFVQVDIMYLEDVLGASWSNNMTNGTTVGTTINHSVFWTEETTFSGYIFSFNNGSGSFSNDTWAPMTSDNWTNVSKVANFTVGSIINWTVYVNDSSNNWNVTSNFNYTTTAAPVDSCTCTDGVDWTIIDGDQCTLATACNLGSGRLRVMDGALRIGATGSLNANGCYIHNSEVLHVVSGGKLNCR